MKKPIGTYLSNPTYYVGSVDLEEKRIWVVIDASNAFTELPLHEDAKGHYFLDEEHPVYLRYAKGLMCS